MRSGGASHATLLSAQSAQATHTSVNRCSLTRNLQTSLLSLLLCLLGRHAFPCAKGAVRVTVVDEEDSCQSSKQKQNRPHDDYARM